MHKIEFMISNGQYKMWSYYLRLRWGRGKNRSLNRMVELCAKKIVAEEMGAEVERAVERLTK